MSWFIKWLIRVVDASGRGQTVYDIWKGAKWIYAAWIAGGGLMGFLSATGRDPAQVFLIALVGAVGFAIIGFFALEGIEKAINFRLALRRNEEGRLAAGEDRSSTGVARSEWNAAEAQAFKKMAVFVERKIESTVTPELQLNAFWVAHERSVELRATSKESQMLQEVDCVVDDIERYAEAHDRYVQSQETHPTGKFRGFVLPGKQNMFFDQPASFGTITAENHRISMGSSTADCRITTVGIWRFRLRFRTKDEREVTKYLCIKWEGEGKIPFPLACPKAFPISKAHPPITPLR